MVIGMSPEMPLQGSDSFGIKFSAIAGKTPVAIEAGKGGPPGGRLFEEFGGFGKLRIFRAHDAEVVVRTGEDLGDERAILLCGFWLRSLRNLGRRLGRGGIRRHAS